MTQVEETKIFTNQSRMSLFWWNQFIPKPTTLSFMTLSSTKLTNQLKAQIFKSHTFTTGVPMGGITTASTEPMATAMTIIGRGRFVVLCWMSGVWVSVYGVWVEFFLVRNTIGVLKESLATMSNRWTSLFRKKVKNSSN